MNKAIIGQLAHQSVHGLEKQARVGPLLSKMWDAGARAAPRWLGRPGKVIGGLASTAPVTLPAAAGAKSMYDWAFPDYASQYDQSRTYQNRMTESIDKFRKGEGHDPGQSSLSRLFGSDVHYSDAERLARANALKDQLKAGTLDDRNYLHQLWAMGGYNPADKALGWFGLGAGQSSAYHKDRMNTAATALRDTPVQGGGFRGMLPGGFATIPLPEQWGGASGLERAKQYHQKLLGQYDGWTPDKRQLRDWSGAMRGALPAMGGVNYPMPLGLPPSLYAPDHISQHYRPQPLTAVDFPTRR